MSFQAGDRVFVTAIWVFTYDGKSSFQEDLCPGQSGTVSYFNNGKYHVTLDFQCQGVICLGNMMTKEKR